MSLSRYDASNAMNCKPRPSKASEHGPKFTPLGGCCSKERAAAARRTGDPARKLRSGSIPVVLHRGTLLAVLAFDLVLRLSETLSEALSKTINRLVVSFQEVHDVLGERCERTRIMI